MTYHFSVLLFSLLLLPAHLWAFETQTTFEADSAPLKILVFLSKDCPCSRSHVPHLNALSEKFKNVHFYGVIADPTSEETKSAINEYFNTQNFRFPVIMDSDQHLVKNFRALKTPHVTVLQRQPNGLYTKIYEGGATDHRDFPQAKKFFLMENLQALSQSQPLPYTAGKSLGCYIRRL